MASQRVWWTRAALVLVRPVPVFEELRDDSSEETQARQEPVLAIVLLAGIAGVLATDFAGRLDLDGVDVAVWAFLGGLGEGFALYFLLGALVYVGGTTLGSTWRYRHARHLLAFSAVPLAVSLPLWAGGFRNDVARTLVVAWAAGLLVLGVRVLHAWPWRRALAASVLPLAVPALALLRGVGVI